MKVSILDITTDPLYIISMCARRCYNSREKDTLQNREAFVKGLIKSGHCYDGETEVLTDKGFIKWKDYKGEKVAVVNPDGTFKGFEIPLNIFNNNYSGKVYQYDILGTILTEGHNLFGRTINNKKDNNIKNSYEYIYKLFPCNLPNITFGNKNNSSKLLTEGERLIRVPSCCYKDESISSLGKLFGFWVGDGCRGYCRKQLVFHLKLKRKIQYLENICNDLKLDFIKQKSDIYVVKANYNLGEILNKNFVKNKQKFIPFFEDTKIIYGIIDGLLNSDGNTGRNNHTSFCSTSRQVIDWIKNFSCLAGYKTTEILSNKKNKNRKELYRITITKFNKRGCPILLNDTRKKDKVKIYNVKDMPVFCVQVSTGIIIVRGKNGKTFLCGNCTPLEFIYVVFDVDGISRSCLQQLARHRIGVGMCVESQRYVEQTNTKYIIPPDLDYNKVDSEKSVIFENAIRNCLSAYKDLLALGVKKEDARFVLPECISTRLSIYFNFRELRHFISLRTDKHAQWEIRALANEFKRLIIERGLGCLVEDIK